MVSKSRKSFLVRVGLILALLGGIFGVLSGEPVYAATLIVTTTNDSGPGSLRQAVIDAAPGDTINFDPSLAGQTIVLSSEINLDKDLSIDGSGLDPAVEISGNLTGRIFNIPSNSSVTLESLLIKDGRSLAGSDGGAIFNDGNLTVRNSTFINNSSGGNGGAIYNRFTLNVSSSTFVSNSAHSGGAVYLEGGIFSNPISSRTIVNSTFVSNQANPVNGRGGGVFNYGSEDNYPGENVPVLANNTFSGNGAYTGGGLYSWGSLFFSHTIFANSTSGGNCVAYMLPGSPTGINNLFDDGIPCGMGDFVSGDPLLGPLSDNGGPTSTMALLPGSPAIDAGTLTCSPTDQRGITRPQGSACDIGAFEYVDPLVPTFTPTPFGIPSLFQPYVNFPAGDGKAVAIGDFNSDGLQDVALTNAMTTTSQLIIFSQSSDGNLREVHTYDAGYQPYSIAVGDLNHDGRTDIVVTNMPSREISVFLQQADGNMAPRVTYSTGTGKLAVAVGDLNQDGLTDVAVSGAELGVFTQNESGTLNPMVTYPAPQPGTSYGDIAIADVNNDGKNDVIKKHGYPQFLIYLQGENGRLGPGLSYSLENCQSFCNIQGLTTGDVSGDGLTDIVISYGGNRPNAKIAVFAQAQDGSLQTPVLYDAYDIPVPVEVADVNQDNLADILVAHSAWSQMSVFLQQADGMSSPYIQYPVPYSDYTAFSMAIGDINHDDLPDVAIADYNHGLIILYHTPSSIPNPSTPTRVPINTPTFTPTSTITPTFTPTSTHTATYTPSPTFTPTNTFTPTSTPPYSYHPLYLSLINGQTIDGVASSDEDVLYFDGQHWSLYFDGSDVGVSSTDLSAFAMLDADTILVSFNTAVTVNGISAAPQDVLRFDAASLGTNTSGTFSMYFDGSDVGLSTSSETIDALSLLPDGRLLLSTTGSPSVPGASGRDEDVLAFTPSTLGSTTSGMWSLYFDGSDVDLADSSEDVDALDLAGGNLYLSTEGSFSVSGALGADEDVFVCGITGLGDVTACDYRPSLYFDGSTWGLAANDVDAFGFPLTNPVPPTSPAITLVP
jgi:hypothetical protein